MISVVIINHNYGQYVGEAIESVLKQTYTDYELIVVDGDSTDHSREVIMSYVTKYPDKITAVFKPTSGQAAGFNVGYKLSRGEIIAFLDADDYFYENKLKKIAELHADSEFVGHSRNINTNSGKIMEATALMDDPEMRPMLLHQYGYIYTYHLTTSCISLKRSLADKIFPMPEENYITFADCYVKIMAQYYSNIKYVNIPLAYYRIHSNQKSKSFGNEDKLGEFVCGLYAGCFKDINNVLRQRNESLIPELTEENFRKAFALANPEIDIHDNGSYVIYGTGANSVCVYRTVTALGGKFIYAIDSNPEKWGKKWYGIEIVSPEQGAKKEMGFDKIIIGSSYYYREIGEKLKELGLKEEEDFILIRSAPNDGDVAFNVTKK